ncbi:MAG TPA: hypothetical protein VGH38_01165 [Bryobacteraceae bacterium]|jgi:hypothetical protein
MVPVRTRWRWLAVLAILTVASAGEFEGLFSGSLQHPAIGYRTRMEHDAVSRLNRKIQEDRLRLRFEGPQGYLRSTLEALDIPIESQIVVFSKTSLMQALISSQHPRSIFFNDSVAIGWVPEEPFVEAAAEDPQQGVIFYTLDQQPAGGKLPQFVRENDCLSCHESYSSLGIPGTLVRSVFPAPNGRTVRELGDSLSDHRSPFEQRWGGWFVTGRSVPPKHLGNAAFGADGERKFIGKGAEMESLAGTVDTSVYLSPYSDVAALMVFNHQMHLINLLTRAGWEVRLAVYDKRPDLETLLRNAAEETVDYMLFVEEAPLPGRIRGTSGFTEKFSARGPRDSKGRSLRQLDLERRLMRYPCSYMIYSAAFDGLPAELQDAIYRRMWQVLSGQEAATKYARLSLGDRQAVTEILHETKTRLPNYFQAVTH